MHVEEAQEKAKCKTLLQCRDYCHSPACASADPKRGHALEPRTPSGFVAKEYVNEWVPRVLRFYNPQLLHTHALPHLQSRGHKATGPLVILLPVDASLAF